MTVDAARKMRSMSVYELAKRTGLTYAVVLRLCSGKSKVTNCTAGTLYGISKVLGIPMETFLEDENVDDRQ